MHFDFSLYSSFLEIGDFPTSLLYKITVSNQQMLARCSYTGLAMHTLGLGMMALSNIYSKFTTAAQVFLLLVLPFPVLYLSVFVHFF